LGLIASKKTIRVPERSGAAAGSANVLAGIVRGTVIAPTGLPSRLKLSDGAVAARTPDAVTAGWAKPSQVQSRSSCSVMATIQCSSSSAWLANVMEPPSAVAVCRSAPDAPNTVRWPGWPVSVSPFWARPSCWASSCGMFEPGWKYSALSCVAADPLNNRSSTAAAWRTM